MAYVSFLHATLSRLLRTMLLFAVSATVGDARHGCGVVNRAPRGPENAEKSKNASKIFSRVSRTIIDYDTLAGSWVPLRCRIHG